MPFESDLAYLRDEMGPAVVEQLVHDWAEWLRDLRREVEAHAGPGNGLLEITQAAKGAHVTDTYMRAPRRYGRRNGSGGIPDK